MNIIDSLEWRYAVKKFDADEKLTEEQLQTLLRALNLTATSYGLQPLKVLVITDPELRGRLKEASYGQSQVVDASHLLVLCQKDTLTDGDVDAYMQTIQKVRNTPSDALEPFANTIKGSLASNTAETVAQWNLNQAYIALGNLLTVCAVEGIDSCPMEGFEKAKYDELLGLNERGLKSALVIPVGYRAEDDVFQNFKKVRKNIDEFVEFV